MNNKLLIRLVGLVMLIYAFLFIIIPLGYFSNFGNIPMIIRYFISAIFYTALGFIPVHHLIWLAYSIPAIGILRIKDWGRITGIYVSEIVSLFYLGYWLIEFVAGEFKNPFKSLMLGTVIPFMLPALIFWVFLNHPKIKKQFVNKESGKKTLHLKVLGWTGIIIGAIGTLLFLDVIYVLLPYKLHLAEPTPVAFQAMLFMFISPLCVPCFLFLWLGLGVIRSKPWDKNINRIVVPTLILIPLLIFIYLGFD